MRAREPINREKQRQTLDCPVSYTETTYHPIPALMETRIACDQKPYASPAIGLLRRDLAAEDCYLETI